MFIFFTLNLVKLMLFNLYVTFFKVHMKIVALARPCLVLKIFSDFPSHRILRHVHRALNID